MTSNMSFSITNANVDEFSRNKKRKKSPIDPSSTSSRKPLTVTQPNASTSHPMNTISTYPVAPKSTHKVAPITTNQDSDDKNVKCESELFRGFEDVNSNSKVLSMIRLAMKRKCESEIGHRIEKLGTNSEVSVDCNSKVLSRCTSISKNVLKFPSVSKCSSKHQRKQSDSQREAVTPVSMLRRLSNDSSRNFVHHLDSSRNFVQSTSSRNSIKSSHHSVKQTSPLRRPSKDSSQRKKKHLLSKAVKLALQCPSKDSKQGQVLPKLRLKPLNFNMINQQIQSAKVVLQPLKYNALNWCSSDETETVSSGGVEYSWSFVNGKHKIIEKQKHAKPDQMTIDDRIPLNDDDKVIPKLCDTSVLTDFQPYQPDVFKIKTEISEIPDVCNSGVQTDAQTLKKLCDFSCQTIFPDAMSESLSSAKEFRRRIAELEQTIEEATRKEEQTLNKFRLRVAILEQSLAQSQRRTEMCQKKIDLCDRCSERYDESPSISIQTPFNQWNSTPVQPQASAPSSSLHVVQNMFQHGMTRTPVNSPLLPTSNTISQGEIVPYGFKGQLIQPSTSLGMQNMMKTDITTGPHSVMSRQSLKISHMSSTRPQAMFSVAPQQLIVRHNVGQYNFKRDLPPNQSSRSHQEFTQQQNLQQSPVASAQNQQWQHQNINCACVQCFQQRHQQFPSLLHNISQPTYNSCKPVQSQPLYNQQLRQQQLSQQQLMQHQRQVHNKQLQVLRQDLNQQQTHQRKLVQQHVVKQRIETEKQAVERLEKERAVLGVTKKCFPKKVVLEKYLPKKC